MPIGFRNLETGLFKCYSSAGPGTLGAVPEGYEEVLLDGPLSPVQVETPEKPIAQQMEEMFLEILTEHGDLITPSQEAAMFRLKAGLIEMFKFNRYAAARAAIEAFTDFPTALAPAKAALHSLIPEVS